MYFKNQISKFSVLSTLCLLITVPAAAQSIDDSQALIDFLNRPKLSPNDAATWATALPKLVGTYVTTGSDGKLKLMGKGTATTLNPTQTDLKNRELYRALISNEQQVGASIVSFFKFSRDKKFVDELIITDLITVTDPDFGLDKCLSNKPLIFDASVKYWCISAVTLSGVQQRKFQKTNKIGSGNYGIVTADGNYSAQMDKQSMQLSANVSVIGPIINGVLVNAESSSTIVKETVGINPALPPASRPSVNLAAATKPALWTKIFGAASTSFKSASPPASERTKEMPQPVKRTGLEGAEISVEKI